MKKTYVIGIAGGSAGGKTTLSNRLKEKLSDYAVSELHMDSYFKAQDERPEVYVPSVDKTYVDDNHPQSFDLARMQNDLKELLESHDYDIIIVEGLLTLWDATIYNALDLKIFVDCRSDERIVRRLKRNMTWGLSFDQISDVYLDLVRYRHDEYVEPTKWKADYIVNGTASTDKATEIIISYVKSEIA